MAVVKFGFTGTRDPDKVLPVQLLMLTEQIRVWRERVRMIHAQDLERIEWHFGMCVGADEFAADLAKSAGFYLVGHPPKNRRLVSIRVKPDEVRQEEDYLDRNRAIVHESGLIFALPKEDHEVLRSGTWATIRYARDNGNPLCIIYPSVMIYEPPSEKWRTANAQHQS